MASSLARWHGGVGRSLLALLLGVGCAPLVEEPSLLGAGEANGSVGSIEPCIETSQRVTGDNPTIVGALASELVARVAGEHSTRLTWTNGDKTRIVLNFTDVRVTSVRSRLNPREDEPYSQRRCVNHARVESHLTLTTADGKLDESLDSVALVAYDADEVHGLFDVAGEDIQGTYRPTLRRRHCYVRSTFRLLVASDGLHGSVTDELGSGVCGVDEVGLASFAGARWGTRWQNY